MYVAAPKIMHIGKIKLTMPAFLVFVFGTILFGISLISAVISGKFVLVVPAILVYGGFLLGSYQVNCMTVGNCNILAWFYGIFYAISTGITIITVVMG
jgi:hypothetical protein